MNSYNNKNECVDNVDSYMVTQEEWQVLVTVVTNDFLNLYDNNNEASITDEESDMFDGIRKFYEMMLSETSSTELAHVTTALCLSISKNVNDLKRKTIMSSDRKDNDDNNNKSQLSKHSVLPSASSLLFELLCEEWKSKNVASSNIHPSVQYNINPTLSLGEKITKMLEEVTTSSLLSEDGLSVSLRVSPCTVSIWAGIWQYVMCSPSLKLENVFRMALNLPRTGKLGLGTWMNCQTASGNNTNNMSSLVHNHEPLSLLVTKFSSKWFSTEDGKNTVIRSRSADSITHNRLILFIIASVVDAALTGMILAKTNSLAFRKAFASGALLLGAYEAGMAAVRRFRQMSDSGADMEAEIRDISENNNNNNVTTSEQDSNNMNMYKTIKLGNNGSADAEYTESNDRILDFYPGSEESMVLGSAYLVHIVSSVLLALDKNTDRMQDDIVLNSDTVDALLKAAIQGIMFGQEGDTRLLFNIPSFIPDETSTKDLGNLLTMFFEYGTTPRYDSTKRNTILRSILTHPTIYGYLQTLIAKANENESESDNAVKMNLDNIHKLEDSKAFSKAENSMTFANIISVLGIGASANSTSDASASVNSNRARTSGDVYDGNTDFVTAKQQARLVSAPFPFNLSFLSSYFDTIDLRTLFTNTVSHFRLDMCSSIRKKAPLPQAFRILQAQSVEAEQKGLRELGTATPLRDAFVLLMGDIQKPSSLLIFNEALYRKVLTEVLKTDVEGFINGYLNDEFGEHLKLPLTDKYSSTMQTLCVNENYGLDVLVCALFNVCCLVHSAQSGNAGLNAVDVLDKIVEMMK